MQSAEVVLEVTAIIVGRMLGLISGAQGELNVTS